MKKTRHHHYVWRKYLRSWASKEKIACLRDGRIFESNLMGVGQEKDFYKLKELNLKDIEFIKKVAIQYSPTDLQEHHELLVGQFNIAFKLKKLIQSLGVNDQKLNDLLDSIIYNLEENWHTDIEGLGIKYIKSILQGDISFYSTDKGCREFIYFLCMQYMRTEKIKKSVFASMTAANPIEIEKTWNILSLIFATNISCVFYTERKTYGLALLKNITAKEFITGDQPVINTYATFSLSETPPDKIELYYPVSPTLAILITNNEEYLRISHCTLTEEEVIAYNKLIVGHSHNQIYATSVSVLEEYNC